MAKAKKIKSRGISAQSKGIGVPSLKKDGYNKESLYWAKRYSKIETKNKYTCIKCGLKYPKNMYDRKSKICLFCWLFGPLFDADTKSIDKK